MRRDVALALVAAAGSSLSARSAFAFCRSMTCPPPPGYPAVDAIGAEDTLPDGSSAGCYPPAAEFEAYCASLSTPRKILPVFWANACISYDINQNASRQVPYATAAQEFAMAFSKWTGTTCAGAAASSGDDASTAEGRVSIDVRDLGPVSCDSLSYNNEGENQNVIIFHDDVWPYDDASNTLGLTTISYNPDTGELDDADMEINATVPLTIGDPVPQGGYDFESIIAHETGHFFGMAHSTDETATMFAHYAPGATSMRILKPDDQAGICTIYPPDGTRTVSTTVTSSGSIQSEACDPTPKGGFISACSAPKASCSVAAGLRGAAGSAPAGSAVAVSALFVLAARRRRRDRRAVAFRV